MANNRTDRMPKTDETGTFKASSQALSYAKGALNDLHTKEVWTLAERLDDAMEEIVEEFIKEIRK